MKHVNYLSFFLLTLFSISFISCSDDDDNKLNTGITNQSWTEGKSLEISQDNELSVSFNAAAKWVASVTSGADWCKLNTTSGTKGQSTLKLSVSTSSTTDRTARISINIDGAILLQVLKLHKRGPVFPKPLKIWRLTQKLMNI